MKRKQLSSNRRAKTEMGACAQDRSGFVPLAALSVRWRARRAQLGATPLLVGEPTTTHASRRRRKSRWGKRITHKDVKNEDRSGNVYENKGQDDNLPDTKGDISAWLHAILHRGASVLGKPSDLLPLFEHWGTNVSLRNVENSGARMPFGPTVHERNSFLRRAKPECY